jgi:hypothetical protein
MVARDALICMEIVASNAKQLISHHLHNPPNCVAYGLGAGFEANI